MNLRYSFCFGFLTAFFSKNMSIVMSVAALLFRQSEYISIEGMEGEWKEK